MQAPVLMLICTGVNLLRKQTVATWFSATLNWDVEASPLLPVAQEVAPLPKPASAAGQLASEDPTRTFQPVTSQFVTEASVTSKSSSLSPLSKLMFRVSLVGLNWRPEPLPSSPGDLLSMVAKNGVEVSPF